jgi:imidazolonepropionase-like amidohydrolase
MTRRSGSLGAFLLVFATAVFAQQSSNIAAPDRRAGDGDGPFDRLVIRGITVIDGTGAPPQGPMDVVVEGNRIAEVRSVGFPGVAIPEPGRPAKGTREIDGTGHYLMPGFIDLHVHTGGPQAPEAEYVYKLWLAHGVTTARGVGFGPMDWSLNERARSAANRIAAPRMFSYHVPFTGDGWDTNKPQTPETAREWVRWAAGKGIDGLKLMAFDPEIMEALLDEAKRHGLGSTAHLHQMGVARMNALQASRLGLGAMTHYYGLFESLLKVQRRAAPLRAGRAVVGQDPSPRQRAVERAHQGMGGSALHHRSDDDDLLGEPRRHARAQCRLA